MTTLALFDTAGRVTREARARRNDPTTSRAAAERVQHATKHHEEKIFAAISAAGEYGATYKEIAEVIGMEEVKVGRRLSAMGERGLIERALKEQPKDNKDFIERDGCAIWWKV